MLTLAAFILFFTLANMFAGGKFQPILRQHGGPLPGRGIYYAGLAAMILGFCFYGWIGVLAGASFLLWRLPGWYGSIDAGTVSGTRLGDFAMMSARGMAAFPVFAFAVYYTGSLGPLWILLGASLGQGVAYEVGHRGFDRNNAIAEGLAGAVWGVAYYALLNAAHPILADG